MQIYCKNLELTPDVEGYLEEKIGKLEKFCDDLIGVRVDLSKDMHHRKGEVFRCEVNIHVTRRILRAEESATDLKAAIDIVQEELLRQIEKYKGRLERKQRFSIRELFRRKI